MLGSHPHRNVLGRSHLRFIIRGNIHQGDPSPRLMDVVRGSTNQITPTITPYNFLVNTAPEPVLNVLKSIIVLNNAQ